MVKGVFLGLASVALTREMKPAKKARTISVSAASRAAGSAHLVPVSSSRPFSADRAASAKFQAAKDSSARLRLAA